MPERLRTLRHCIFTGELSLQVTERARTPAGDSAKQKIPEAEASGNLLEVTTRFELVDEGFADPCLTTWPRHHIGSDEYHSNGAADEARTRYLHLGKVALYQMSYGRILQFLYPETAKQVVPPFGIEPMTRGFSVPCSTD